MPRPEAALTDKKLDILVIGGGITGAGIALEAARAGLKVALLEQKDFSWGTSSRSSKMVHGGLRYIAQGDIRLTHESLHERERLLKELPGLVYRQLYLFPHHKRSFPGRYVFGSLLMFYDFLAGISDRKYIKREATLKRMPGLENKSLKGASTYTDALTNDSRLVMRTLQEAVNYGAEIFNYTRVLKVSHLKDSSDLALMAECQSENGRTFSIEALVVANATGAFADELRPGNEKKVRPLRGSHIVFPKYRLPISGALTILHHKDNRPIFIYPWAGRTLVGTTDIDHKEDLLNEPSITQQEIDYLLEEIHHQFPQAGITTKDIIATFSGVRPVVSSGSGVNPSAERRDHAVWDDNGFITVTGGKLTTFRIIAHDVMTHSVPYFAMAGLSPKLHHGDLFDHKDNNKNNALAGNNDYLKYLCACYGTRFSELLNMNEGTWPIESTPHCLSELAFSLKHESVVHLDDLLLRRSRLGLLLDNGAESLKEQLKSLCEKYASWNTEKFEQEWKRYQDIWKTHYYLPGEPEHKPD